MNYTFIIIICIFIVIYYLYEYQYDFCIGTINDKKLLEKFKNTIDKLLDSPNNKELFELENNTNITNILMLIIC
jgi:hypothetical protein